MTSSIDLLKYIKEWIKITFYVRFVSFGTMLYLISEFVMGNVLSTTAS